MTTVETHLADGTPPLLQVTNLVKQYPGVRALGGVDLTVAAGEVHCLVGQNGAGKSTLIKCIGGSVTPTSGEVRLLGELVQGGKPSQSLKLGVATMYQELDLVNDLSVTANIFLGHEKRLGPLLDSRWMKAEAKRLLLRLGHSGINPDAMVGTLRPADKQLVSMARALSYNVKLLIMDEPSAILDPPEVDALFEVVRRLAGEGVGVVYISHRLDEIERIGNRITVIRDGVTVASNLPATTSTDELASLMVGRTLEEVFPTRTPHSDKVIMTVKGLTHAPHVFDASFEVRAGEVLGIAGLVGAGRTELLRALYGIDNRDSGEVTVDGKVVKRGRPDTAIAAGLGLAPEERKSEGLWLGWSQIRNATISDMRRFAKGPFTDDGAEAATASKHLESLSVAPKNPNGLASDLSGGNQQKVVLARWLLHHCKVLLLDEPTRGVDVGAKADVYRVIAELAASGLGIVMVSSELAEIVGFSDRVLVMREGRIVAELDGPSSSEEDVLRHALRTGHDTAAIPGTGSTSTGGAA